MRIPRIFSATRLATGSTVKLGPTAARHAREALRLKAGDRLVLFDGAGGEYDSLIERITRDEVEVRPVAHREVERESPVGVHVGQGLARGERMDFIVQKAVELGAAEITPLATIRTVVKLTRERAERRVSHWRTIAEHASEQCGRTRVPTVHAPSALDSWLAATDANMKLALNPNAEQGLEHAPAAVNSVALLIGPEGGLADAELASAEGAGFKPVRLGPRTLRTETAAVVALAAIQLRWGDLDRG